MVETEAKRDKELGLIGNLVYHDVPISNDEAENAITSQWGEIPELKVDGTIGHLHHHEIMECMDMVEFERG
jgi:seryl-tRNA synthetase